MGWAVPLPSSHRAASGALGAAGAGRQPRSSLPSRASGCRLPRGPWQGRGVWRHANPGRAGCLSPVVVGTDQPTAQRRVHPARQRGGADGSLQRRPAGEPAWDDRYRAGEAAGGSVGHRCVSRRGPARLAPCQRFAPPCRQRASAPSGTAIPASRDPARAGSAPGDVSAVMPGPRERGAPVSNGSRSLFAGNAPGRRLPRHAESGLGESVLLRRVTRCPRPSAGSAGSRCPACCTSRCGHGARSRGAVSASACRRCGARRGGPARPRCARRGARCGPDRLSDRPAGDRSAAAPPRRPP